MIAHVAPLRRMPNAITHFSYLIPEELEPRIARGSLVEIPLRGRMIAGIVLTTAPRQEGQQLKPIARYLGIRLERHVDLLEEAAAYFAVTAPYLADALIPEPPKRWKSDILPTIHQTPHTPFQDERRLIEIDSIDAERQHLQTLIDGTQERKRAVHIVVPTIERAKAIMDMFDGDERVMMVTSELSAGKLWSAFIASQRGEIDILITTRRGILFTPSNVGRIIVVDEESSDHKQWDMKPRYDTRTIAEMIAKRTKCGLIMMSRAPRLTTRNSFPYQTSLPNIPDIIVHVNTDTKHPFSQPTLDAIEHAQDEGKKVVVLSDVPIDGPKGITVHQSLPTNHHPNLVILLYPDRQLYSNEWTAEERMHAQILGITKTMRTDATLIIVATTPHRAFAGLLPKRRDEYFRKLLDERREQQYPPFGAFMKIIVQSTVSMKDAEKKAEELSKRIIVPHIEVLGPYPSDPPTVRGRHRALILLHGTKEAIQAVKPRCMALDDAILIDIDPERIFR